MWPTWTDPGALTAGLNWYRATVPAEAVGAANPMPLPAVTCPAWGVWASDEPYLTEAQMLASAEHCAGDWRYHRLDGVGHWIPLEAPELTTNLIRAFVSRAGAVSLAA
jgi:pimeloyl-ACP methyl ester carboxylesterase